MDGNVWVTAVIFVLYLALMIAIGAYFYKKNRTIKDYVLGGRKLSPWTSALSAQASDMSGWLLLGLPGTAYVLYGGTAEAIWTAIGLAIGTYFNWLIVAKRLRKYTQLAKDSVTLPSFFKNRYHDESGVLLGVCAVFVLFFFLFYTASMFSSGAKLFSTAFGMSYELALIIGTLVIVSYTFLGGFMAVCWTDFIQGLLMFFALIITPIVALFHTGGSAALGDLISNAAAGAKFTFLPTTPTGGIAVLTLISAIAWGLGYFGQPHILPRFMAIRHPNEIRPARIIAMVWVVISLACAIIVGVIGSGMYPDLADSETVLMVMLQDLFPPILTGIFLTAILAAIMSTADSQLLVVSSAISSDIYNGMVNKEAKEKKVLWIGRISVIVVSIIAAFLVSQPNAPEGSIMYKINESVFKLVAFAWGGFGSAFGPLMLFSLFWERTTKPAAITGVIVGGVTCLIWWLLDGGIFDVYEIVPGFIFSCIAIVVVSLLTKVPQEVVDEFRSVKEADL